jgi:hypothetical protein
MAEQRQAGEGAIFIDDALQLWTARVPSSRRQADGRRSRDLKIVKKWFVETKATIERGLPPEPRESETLGAFLRHWIEVSLLNERRVGRQPRTVVHIQACLRVAQRDAKR